MTAQPPALPDPRDTPVVPEAPLDGVTAEGLVLILDEMRRRAHARYWTTKRRTVGRSDPLLLAAGARIAALDDVIAAVSSYLSAGQAGAGSLYRHAKVVSRCPRCRARARLDPSTVGHVRKSPTPRSTSGAAAPDDETRIIRPGAGLDSPDDPLGPLPDELPF